MQADRLDVSVPAVSAVVLPCFFCFSSQAECPAIPLFLLCSDLFQVPLITFNDWISVLFCSRFQNNAIADGVDAWKDTQMFVPSIASSQSLNPN